jgi:hypothetical protein
VKINITDHKTIIVPAGMREDLDIHLLQNLVAVVGQEVPTDDEKEMITAVVTTNTIPHHIIATITQLVKTETDTGDIIS